jgi:hypothetical protein
MSCVYTNKTQMQGAPLAKGIDNSLRVASRTPSRKTEAAAISEMIGGSLTKEKR